MRQRGFSYIGLLIMIAMVGAMGAGALTAGATLERRATEEELLFVGSQFQAAFKTYYESSPPGVRRYPNTLNDLVLDKRFPAIRRHLRKIYADPMTGSTEWGIVEAPGGGIMGIYSLSTEHPIRQAGFDVQFRGFEAKKKYSDWIFSYIYSGESLGASHR